MTGMEIFKYTHPLPAPRACCGGWSAQSKNYWPQTMISLPEGPIEKVLRALDELGKIIKAQETVIAEKDRRIEEYRLERNRHTNDIAALEARLDERPSL